ncbi:M20/M25/M40 family metallo-hydrolase [Cohnella sp. GCM10027633]|uniref:M20/M25/M40 family metallo-hydrolase n=1 Tax=unclassified Cohnella TaxID=2636738 RepID=UPI003636CC20
MFGKRRVLGMLACFMLAGGAIAPGAMAEEAGVSPLKEGDPGYYAYETTRYISETFGTRVAGSEEEAAAGEYIMAELLGMGLAAEKQPFEYRLEEDGPVVASANIVATKPGASSRVLYVGAHYDTVEVGKGADDNASGIGVMLEAAKAVAKAETPYTIKFIAFGSEEVGLIGSEYFVSLLTHEEIENAVAMINLDSLAVGDDMHVYGSEGADGFVRELGLDIAKRLGLNVTTQAGLNPDYPAGTTIDASDHVHFKYAGIPYGYLEATNWTLGKQDGYTQTVKDGEIWHTEKDTLDYVTANYPGRIEEHLSTFTRLLTRLLLEIRAPRATTSFEDLDGVPWASASIRALYAIGVAVGDGNGHYEPSKTVSRAELTAMLVRAYGLLDPEATATFADVKPGDWHYPYVASAAALGLVQGFGDDLFEPSRPITREEMAVLGAKIMTALTGKTTQNADAALAGYEDAGTISAGARTAVSLLTEQGVVSGVADGIFAPKGIVTRAQAAVMIYGLLGVR